MGGPSGCPLPQPGLQTGPTGWGAARGPQFAAARGPAFPCVALRPVGDSHRRSPDTRGFESQRPGAAGGAGVCLVHPTPPPSTRTHTHPSAHGECCPRRGRDRAPHPRRAPARLRPRESPAEREGGKGGAVAAGPPSRRFLQQPLRALRGNADSGPRFRCSGHAGETEAAGEGGRGELLRPKGPSSALLRLLGGLRKFGVQQCPAAALRL